MSATGSAQAANEPRWEGIEANETELRARCHITVDLPCFAGHFPGQPILPGVLQLRWALALAAGAFAGRYPQDRFAGLARIKFKQPVVPPATLGFELKEMSSGLKLRVLSAAGLHCEGHLKYRD